MPNAFTKSCTFENFYGQCAAFRLGVAETACRAGVLCADSMNTCMSGWWYYSAAPIGFLKSASFSERVSPVSGFLSLPFLTRFPHMRWHIQGQGFGNKMYISELFTVIGYLHTAGFKTRRGINFAKCKCCSIAQCNILVSPDTGTFQYLGLKHMRPVLTK